MLRVNSHLHIANNCGTYLRALTQFQDNPPAEESQVVDKVLGIRMRKQAVGPKIEEQVQTLQVTSHNSTK